MPTLYVSDLDGTLLRRDQRTSARTNRLLNALIEDGMRFSYATARSFHTARQATVGLSAAFPVIVYNGTLIKDNRSGEVLWQHRFEPHAIRTLLADMLAADISPLVYAFIDGKEHYSFYPATVNEATASFLRTHAGDERERAVTHPAQLTDGDIFYITCIGDEDRLRPFYDRCKTTYRCLYQNDLYSGERWLEIMPPGTSKANAVNALAALLDCDRVIAFGDGLNDLDLFDIADEAYAVENAVPALKERATAVIPSNENDGVAVWLYEHHRQKGETLCSNAL